MQLMLRKKARPPDVPPPPPPGLYPPLKIPQDTAHVSSTGYRSAPATEFRDSIAITSPVGEIGHVSDATQPAPPGSGFSNFIDFHIAEMQYLGIRHLRTTPNYLNGSAMQFARNWGHTMVGTKEGRLCIEPGRTINIGSANNPRCSGVFTADCCGSIDARLGAFVNDPDVARAISILELLNEPNQSFSGMAYAGVNGPNTPGTDGLTWIQCMGEYNKHVWEKYILGDPRCAHMQTVATCPTSNYVIDSEWAGDVPDGLDIFTQWGSVEPYTQFSNSHPYCGHLKPGGSSFTYNDNYPYQPIADGWDGMMRGHGGWPSRRGMPTEFGYVILRSRVTDWWSLLPTWQVYANYFLKTFLEAFIRGFERVYWFKLFPQGPGQGGLPRTGFQVGAPDDYSIYDWDANTNNPTYWWYRTQAVEAMHRMTTTVGDGTAQPSMAFSFPSPDSSVRWLMLRNTSHHVLAVWRFVDEVQQPSTPLGQHNTGQPSPSVVSVAPLGVRVNIPAATQVVETHPLTGAGDTTLTPNGFGSSRGVDLAVDEKPLLLVID